MRNQEIKTSRHGEILYDTSGNPAAVITGSYASNGLEPWEIRGKKIWLAVALAAKRGISITWGMSTDDTTPQDIPSIEKPIFTWKLADVEDLPDGNGHCVSSQSSEANMDGSFSYSQPIKNSRELTDAIVAHNPEYKAAKFARQLVLEDFVAMDLPRIDVLMRIRQMRHKIDAIDPTASTNPSKQLNDWGFGSEGGVIVWSASEGDSVGTWGVVSSGFLSNVIKKISSALCLFWKFPRNGQGNIMKNFYNTTIREVQTKAALEGRGLPLDTTFLHSIGILPVEYPYPAHDSATQAIEPVDFRAECPPVLVPVSRDRAHQQ